MIKDIAFKNRITAYIRDELSTEERRQMEIYLREHPEAVDEMTRLHDILNLTDAIREDHPPDGLLESVKEGVLARIEQQPDRSRKSWLPRRLPFPVPRMMRV